MRNNAHNHEIDGRVVMDLKKIVPPAPRPRTGRTRPGERRRSAARRIPTPAALPILMAGWALTLCAQWPSYPTPGIPRTPDGKPDLQAPAPRMSNGKPDFSGIWENFRRNAGAQAAGQAAGGAPLASFRDLGSGMKDGLPLQPWAAALKKQRMAEHSKDNPDAHCLPMGLLQFHMHPQPRKIIQTPAEMLILYEANGGIRQIYTDGRPLPPRDVEPWWYGYSVGHWDGDTLVVETTGLRDGGWLDINGSPLTGAAKLVERFRRPTFGALDIEITVDDPKAYTRPFTVSVAQRLTPDTELIEFICNENDDSPRHMVGK